MGAAGGRRAAGNQAIEKLQERLNLLDAQLGLKVKEAPLTTGRRPPRGRSRRGNAFLGHKPQSLHLAPRGLQMQKVRITIVKP